MLNLTADSARKHDVHFGGIGKVSEADHELVVFRVAQVKRVGIGRNVADARIKRAMVAERMRFFIKGVPADDQSLRQ
ncbi:MAG: hypothetical protein WBF24_16565 [Xanthobacteraceae bacterium]